MLVPQEWTIVTKAQSSIHKVDNNNKKHNARSTIVDKSNKKHKARSTRVDNKKHNARSTTVDNYKKRAEMLDPQMWTIVTKSIKLDPKEWINIKLEHDCSIHKSGQISKENKSISARST